MFGDDKDRSTYRAVDPPRPVVVALGRVWPPGRLGWGLDTPLWARAGGIDVAAHVPGELHAWVLTSAGRWWPYVRFTVRSSNGCLELPMDQLVPTESVEPQPSTHVSTRP